MKSMPKPATIFDFPKL
jgi:hypothetical protein